MPPARSMGRQAARATRNAVLGLIALCFASGVTDARQIRLKPYTVPSSSMSPTLEVGDIFFVTASPTVARGDVIVLGLPRDPSIDYVKRVVGLPGDRIRVRHGLLSINGKTLVRTPDGPCSFTTGDGDPEDAQCYHEVLPGGRSHVIAKLNDTGPSNNTGEYVVPKGDLFVMGDNRDNSLDSRFPKEVGYIPLENVRGVARVIYFSRDISRIFKRID